MNAKIVVDPVMIADLRRFPDAVSVRYHFDYSGRILGSVERLEIQEELDTLRDLAVTGVLTKPFDPVQLLKALKWISFESSDSRPARSHTFVHSLSHSRCANAALV